ncbi:MAG TPA: hypothetical protein VGU25_17870 [Acidobacteriaceae bacterium]|nr:hypothetical protein [Acidobacteriaceae bacterium]
MRAVRRSPWFRIALLSLAVLFAHTGHAATRSILPDCHPNTVKVAATRLESEKKLSLAVTRLVRPARLAHRHTSFASFDLAGAYSASLLSLPGTGHLTFARWSVSTDPQRRPFALRI